MANPCELIVTISIHKPWWAHLAFAGAKAWLWLGLPLDIDVFSKWLAGSFKITTTTSPSRDGD